MMPTQILITAACTSILTFIVTMLSFFFKRYCVAKKETRKHYIATVEFFKFILEHDSEIMTPLVKHGKDGKCPFPILALPLFISLVDIGTFCSYNNPLKTHILTHIFSRETLIKTVSSSVPPMLDTNMAKQFLKETNDLIKLTTIALRPENIDRIL